MYCREVNADHRWGIQTSNWRKPDDLLPFESPVVSSLCSVFGPLLTVGDTPTE